VNRKSEFRKTLVRRGATLGANSTIVCGVTIGRYAFVGAGAVVNRDLPAHAIAVGVPARQIGWACQCGVRLQGSAESWYCGECGSAYHLSGNNLVQTTVRPASAPLEIAKAMAASASDI
jgi:UDP-2-acetamido-3-amino-2,3-dideoxy-glucuronate N-acetyltransferase